MAVDLAPDHCWIMTATGRPSAVLELRRREVRPPGPGEVRVRVSACGLNFLDVLACEGNYPNQPPPPLPLGVELTGDVLESGPGAAMTTGERVLGIAPLPLGALASGCTLPAYYLHRLPSDVPAVVAAALPVNYQTAHFALHRLGHLHEGETLLVHAGAGGVGTAAIQLGLAAGATVVAVASNEEKRERCRLEGATVAIDSRSDTLAADVLDATAGHGADLVVDSVGGRAFDASLEAVAFEGRVLVVGFSSGEIPAPALTRLLARNATVTGLSWGEHYPRRDPRLVADVYEQLFALLAAGTIAPRVEVVGFDEVPAALDRLAERRSQGKLVCDPNG